MPTTITTRAAKGSELTWNEGDDNFTNLNAATLPVGGSANEVLIKSSTTDYDTTWAPFEVPPILPTFTVPSTAGGTYLESIATFVGNTAGSQALTPTGGSTTAGPIYSSSDWISKIPKSYQLVTAAGNTPAGWTTNLVIANGAGLYLSWPYTLGFFFATHPTSENTTDVAKFVGVSGSSFSSTPTGGNYTNNSDFNTGPAFGLVSNAGDANWSFFYKENSQPSTVTSTGLARTANQHLSLLITQPVSGNATVVLRSFDNTTGVSTIEFQTTASLNVTINSTILINSYAEATATHGIVFHRMFAYVPDNAFITPS